MAPDPSADPPFNTGGLKFAFGAAIFGMAATLIAIAVEEKRVPDLLESGPISIGSIAALFAFFASWAAYHWTRNHESLISRIISLTLLVPFLMFLPLVPIGALGTFAFAGALVAFSVMKFGVAFLLATLAWSTIFLCLRSKRSS